MFHQLLLSRVPVRAGPFKETEVSGCTFRDRSSQVLASNIRVLYFKLEELTSDESIELVSKDALKQNKKGSDQILQTIQQSSNVCETIPKSVDYSVVIHSVLVHLKDNFK